MESITQKMLVGRELLDRALQMYFDGAYFAAIHLAGAAEEVLGGYLKRGGHTTAAESLHDGAIGFLGYHSANVPKSTTSALHQLMHHARNRTKHLNEKGDDKITFDPKGEAEAILGRALANFYDLMGRTNLQDTPRMRQFDARRSDV